MSLPALSLSFLLHPSIYVVFVIRVFVEVAWISQTIDANLEPKF